MPFSARTNLPTSRSAAALSLLLAIVVLLHVLAQLLDRRLADGVDARAHVFAQGGHDLSSERVDDRLHSGGEVVELHADLVTSVLPDFVSSHFPLPTFTPGPPT